jgi:hypothetical protein
VRPFGLTSASFAARRRYWTVPRVKATAKSLISVELALGGVEARSNPADVETGRYTCAPGSSPDVVVPPIDDRGYLLV